MLKRKQMNKIFYLIMSILLMSCHNQSPAKLWEDANLLRLENNMKDCIINLDDLIAKYPHHDLAAKAQFQKAEIYLNDIKDYDISIEEFEKVIRQYPSHDVSKKSLFMIAYIYNNYLNAYSDAIIHYSNFLDKFPAIDVIMPQVSISPKAGGTILQFNKKVGDSIAKDETLCEISFDKTNMKVPAPVSGTVLEIIPQINDVVLSGNIISRIGDALIPSVEYELQSLYTIEGIIDSLNLIIDQ